MCKAPGPQTANQNLFVKRPLGYLRIGELRAKKPLRSRLCLLIDSTAQILSSALERKHLYHLACPSEPGKRKRRKEKFSS